MIHKKNTRLPIVSGRKNRLRMRIRATRFLSSWDRVAPFIDVIRLSIYRSLVPIIRSVRHRVNISMKELEKLWPSCKCIEMEISLNREKTNV